MNTNAQLKSYHDHRWLASVKKLVPVINLLSSRPKGDYVDPMVKLVSHLLKHKGEKRAIQLLKLYRLSIQQVVTHQSLTNILFCKTDKDNFPKVLKPWKSLTTGSLESQRLVLSYWRVIESFRLPPEWDLSTVSEASSADPETVTEICDWIKDWTGLRALGPLPRGRIIMSNAAGPNGPATLSCQRDLSALRADGPLYQDVKTLLGEGNLNYSIDDYEVEPGTWKHSKIVALSDKTGKTRIIAIGDWWSNVALSPIHDAVMRGLRRLHRSDLTFRQSSLPILIKGLGEGGLYSSDLTAFTDRFPIEILRAVVASKWGSALGDVWQRVLVNRVFHSKVGETKYQVGNPMGFLSSWAVSTIAHHAVKEFCAWKCGKKKYKYLILGDDCLDTDKEVYKTYLAVIGKLGVNVSLSKCTQSEIGYTEFAKRIFGPYGELTGIPVDLLLGILERPEQVIELVRILRERGYTDNVIIPGVQALIASWKTKKTIALVLSAPQELLGMPPINLEGVQSETEKFLWPEGPSLDIANGQAREYVFWKEVDKIVEAVQNGKAPAPRKGVRVPIPEDFPPLVEIGDRLMSYISQDGGEYSIWEGWVNGKGYEMAFVPSIDQYRYRRYKYANRGHMVTKSKYLVLRSLIAIAKGDLDPVTFTNRTKLTNFELFQLGFPDEGIPGGIVD